MPAPKILVIFYSRSGTTRRIAQALSAALGGSVEEIAEDRGRNGFLGYLRSVIEARRKRSANIRPARNDPRSFDLVVIGAGPAGEKAAALRLPLKFFKRRTSSPVPAFQSLSSLVFHAATSWPSR